jgi:hypothetical protein
MNRPLLHLPRWQRRLLLVTALLLLASGATWLLVHYLWGAGAGEMPHPWELTLMRLHGAGAFLGLFTLGVFCAHHVPTGWRVTRHARADHPGPGHAKARAHGYGTEPGSGLQPLRRSREQRRRQQRLTGLVQLGLATALVLTGYTLYYLAPEDWRPTVGWIHASLGLLMALTAWAHGVRRHSAH